MSLVEWFKAWRRGEKRVGPKGARGRVFTKKHYVEPTVGYAKPKSGGVPAKTEPIGQISARVWRADKGEWEDHGVISRGPLKDGVIQNQKGEK